MSLFQVVGRDGTENPSDPHDGHQLSPTDQLSLCRKQSSIQPRRRPPGQPLTTSGPGEERSTRPGRPRALCNIFNCQTAKFHQPQLWSGLGSARLFFHSPKREGAWRARADARRRNAPVQRATGFSRFRVPRCPDPSRPGSSRRGSSGVRPGVQLRTTPAGAGPAPPS